MSMWKRQIARRIMKKLKICKRMPTIMIVTKEREGHGQSK